MQRRQFIHAAVGTIFVSSTAGASDFVTHRTSGAPVVVFFDERFSIARRLAEIVADRAPLVPVRGDVADTWRRAVTAGKSLFLRGVTTESFAFCLEVLAQDRYRTTLDITRYDRDLYLWTLQTRTSRHEVAKT